MPKGIIYAVLVMSILAMIPPALIARTRAVQTPARRLHMNLDMDLQGKLLPQDPSELFADGRAMRPPVVNTLAREDYELQADAHFYKGVVFGVGGGSDGKPAWATDFPAQARVTEQSIKHGQERFNIYCRPCHGYSGYGDGIVNVRAQQLLNTGVGGTVWVQPKSIHEAAIREQPVGQIFNSITNGVRNMAGYASQIPVADRWAIVSYVKALQLSQHAEIDDVPAAERAGIQTITLPASQRPK